MKLRELFQFYEQKHPFSCSIEVISPFLLRCPDLQLLPEQYLHRTACCRQNKLSANFNACCRNKSRTLALAQQGAADFHCCPQGLDEWVQPVMLEERLACVLYLTQKVVGDMATEDRRLFAGCGNFLGQFIHAELQMFMESLPRGRKIHDEAFYVDSCLHFIRTNYTQNIGLDDLAERLRMNPNYLGALLKRQTGRTFRGHLHEIRLQQAKVFLGLHRSLSIARVAAMCGFADSNYFSTCFHRLCGCTPREYRRQAAPDDGKDRM